MARDGNLVRRSFFVDEGELRRAKRVLGAVSDAETVRMSIERVAEMERFWRWMDKTSGTMTPADFDEI